MTPDTAEARRRAFPIVYLAAPVSAATKQAMKDAGRRILDAAFAPPGYEHDAEVAALLGIEQDEPKAKPAGKRAK